MFYNICADRRFNGIVSVEKDGVPIFEKVNNDLPGEDPTSKSQFFIGSISKQMLAAIILKYVELGILDLYAPIGKYTLENLLTHTSGLVPSKGRERASDYRFNLKKKGSFSYANQGYELAAKILTQATGKSLEALYQELFQQCDMRDSFIMNDDNCDISTLKETHPMLVQGYIYVPLLHAFIISRGIFTEAWSIKRGYTPAKQPFRDGFQYIYPEAGNVVSTVKDLHKWNQSFEKLFKDKQEFTKSRVFNIKDNGKRYDFCLGFRKSIQGPLEYGQSGWVYGYQSTSTYFPEQKMSVVILENVSRIGGIKAPPLDFSAHDKIASQIRFSTRNLR
jgi:D-alanyl-D-alanine carboxypeptidase